jgi:hypothetical protein
MGLGKLPCGYLFAGRSGKMQVGASKGCPFLIMRGRVSPRAVDLDCLCTIFGLAPVAASRQLGIKGSIHA